MSMFRKSMFWLGLGSDEEYEQYDESAANRQGPRPAEPDRVAELRPVQGHASQPVSANVRPVSRIPQNQPQMARPQAQPQRPTPKAHWQNTESDHPSVYAASAVRIVKNTTTKPHAISPASFNDAQDIGDRFKSGQPVVINLQEVTRDTRRRIVDFASGLCYALGGKMDRIAKQVYMLIPADVQVSQADTDEALN